MESERFKAGQCLWFGIIMMGVSAFGAVAPALRLVFPDWFLWELLHYLGEYGRWRRTGLGYQRWQVVVFLVGSFALGCRITLLGLRMRRAEARADS